MNIRVMLYMMVLCVSVLAAQETIKLGYILPLTGPYTVNGEDCRAAAQMRIEEQLSKSAARYKYEAVFEDGQNLPKSSMEAFWKLKSVDHIDIVFTIQGGAGAVVSTTANNQKIIHMGAGWSTAIAKPPYSFNNLATAKTNAALMARFLKAAGYRKVAMISQQNASTNTLEEAFKQIAPAEGIEIVSIQKFAPPERDFRVAILKAREAKPDVVFVHAFDPEAEIIVRQMREIGYSVPITAMGHWASCHTKVLEDIPWVEFVGAPEFTARLEKRMGHYPFVIAGSVYDSTSMIIEICEAYKGQGKPSADYIAQALHQIRDYPGVNGQLTPDENGWFGIPPVMAIKTNGQIRALSLEEAAECYSKLKK